MEALADATGNTTSFADLDDDGDVLWCGGVRWNVREGQGEPGLEPHLLTTPYPPQDGEHPGFDLMLEAQFPDPELQEWVLRVMARCFHGVPDKALIELRGAKFTGKTPFATYFRDLLGGYARTISDDMFDGSKETTVALAELPGLRMAYLDEWTDRKAGASRTRLKTVTGGGNFSLGGCSGCPWSITRITRWSSRSTRT
jgi:hypothetical protein